MYGENLGNLIKFIFVWLIGLVIFIPLANAFIGAMNGFDTTSMYLIQLFGFLLVGIFMYQLVMFFKGQPPKEFTYPEGSEQSIE